jgi:hypothetical protein
MQQQTVLHNDRALLASYPRARPPLGPEYRAIYVDHYRANRSSAIVRGLESWMHRSIGGRGGTVLDLGAGNLNHVPYERGAAAYDAIEPFRGLWEDSPYRSSVRAIYRGITEVPAEARYDRIVSVAVLEHLIDLPWIVARCGQLLAPAGRFRAGIPSEGGLLWGAAWRGTTGLAFRVRRGLAYGPLMRHEHVNSAREVLHVVRHFFRAVRIRRFPSPWFHLSFYTAIYARSPRLERCAAYCASRPPAEEAA